MGLACCVGSAVRGPIDEREKDVGMAAMPSGATEELVVKVVMHGLRTADDPGPGPDVMPCASSASLEQFAMRTVSMETFLALKAMESFGSLRARGALCQAGDEARIHFISHEWLGFSHPDPAGQQLRRMQEVFRAAIEGRILDLFDPHVWKAYSERVSVGSMGKFRKMEAGERASDAAVLTEKDFSEHVAKGEVWLDYGSIPQAVDFDDPTEAEALQQRAVRSIPAYLERCDYFWALTPTAKHEDKGTWCSFTTWRSRGWCRLEEWGNYLSTNACAPLIITHAPKLSTIGILDFTLASQGKPALAPCAGAFTCCQLGHKLVLPSGAERRIPCDKDFVYPVLRHLFYYKLRHLRGQPDKKFMHATLIASVLPMIFGGVSSAPTWSQEDLEKETVEEFVDRLALKSVTELILPSYTVWHWASVLGHLPMLRKLQAEPAAMAMFGFPRDPRDEVFGANLVAACAVQGRVASLELLLGAGLVKREDLGAPNTDSGITAVDRAAKYGFPEMVQYLLSLRAFVDARRSDGSRPLHGAAQGGHAACCRALLEHRADVNAADKQGRSPLHLAADPVSFQGDGAGKPEVIEVLLEHRADPSLKDLSGATPLDIASAALFHEGKDILSRGGRFGVLVN